MVLMQALMALVASSRVAPVMLTPADCSTGAKAPVRAQMQVSHWAVVGLLGRLFCEREKGRGGESELGRTWQEEQGRKP